MNFKEEFLKNLLEKKDKYRAHCTMGSTLASVGVNFKELLKTFYQFHSAWKYSITLREFKKLIFFHR